MIGEFMPVPQRGAVIRLIDGARHARRILAPTVTGSAIQALGKSTHGYDGFTINA